VSSLVLVPTSSPFSNVNNNHNSNNNRPPGAVPHKTIWAAMAVTISLGSLLLVCWLHLAVVLVLVSEQHRNLRSLRNSPLASLLNAQLRTRNPVSSANHNKSNSNNPSSNSSRHSNSNSSNNSNSNRRNNSNPRFSNNNSSINPRLLEGRVPNKTWEVTAPMTSLASLLPESWLHLAGPAPTFLEGVLLSHSNRSHKASPVSVLLKG